jgi:hypothetical protein
MEEREKFPLTSNEYDLVEEIGRGGSATVMRGMCRPLAREVAIKIINLEESKVLLDVIRVSLDSQ